MKTWVIIVIVVSIVVAIGLALGLGLGLGLNSNNTTSAGTAGLATVSFIATNSTPSSSTLEFINMKNLNLEPGDTFTPSYFGMKLVAVYLSEDIDEEGNNIGNNQMIYLNPTCQGEIDSCGISSSFPNQITDFFDFSRSTAEIQEELAATPFEVNTGIYRYVRMEFCRTESSSASLDIANVEFTANDMSAPYQYSYGQCGITNQFESPITISEGDSVIVNLSFDLSDTVTYQPSSTNQECSSEGYCFSVPVFTPSIVTI